MALNDIVLDVQNDIATITFCRPQVGNAWSKDTTRELLEVIEACGGRDDVRVLVFTGQGKHFCSGGDVRRFKNLIEAKQYLDVETITRAGRMAASLHKCPKPTIAMVNGVAAGAGFSLALACDFRVATPASKFVMAFIKMGLSGDTGGFYHLQKIIGVAKATELMMTGDAVTGEQAKKMGLLTILADEEKLSEETYRLAERLAAGPAFAIARQKALLQEFVFHDEEAYTHREAEYMQACSRMPDFEEAVNAFLEKRSPKFGN